MEKMMTTEKTFVQLLAEDMGEKNVPAIVVEKLEAGGYDSVQVLQENPTTKDEFLAMEVPMLWAKKLAAKYGPQESPVPVLVPTPAPTDLTDLDALIVDQKVAEFSWTRIKTLQRSMVTTLVQNFFADTTSTTSTGYRFMEAMRTNTQRPVIAKVRGQVNQIATEVLVWRLIQGTAVINGDIFELSPTEKFVVCDLSEVNTKMLKRDVMSPTGGTLPVGAMKNSYGVTLYDAEGGFVLPEAVQQFLALAFNKNEINDLLMRQMARDWRGRESEVTVEELQYEFPKTWEEVTLRDVEQYPPLEVKEGENRPPFGNGVVVNNDFDQRLPGLWAEIEQNIQIGPMVSFDVDNEMFYAKAEQLRVGGVQINIRREGSRENVTFTAKDAESFGFSIEWFGLSAREGTKMVINLHRTVMAQVSTPASNSSGLPSPTLIRDEVIRLYDDGELRTLCMDLGIDYEDLAGDRKSGKAQDLVAYMQRQERLSELVNTIKRQRPHAKWEMHL